MQELSEINPERTYRFGGKQWQGSRLKEIIDQKFSGNAAALARICGQIDNQSPRNHSQRISSYLAGKSIPSYDAACVIAQAANVSLDWFAGAGEMGTLEGEGDRVAIPIANASASAGDGADMFSPGEFDDCVIYSRDMLRREIGVGKRLAFINVSGTDMEPTLRAGDRLLVAENNGDPVIDGAIYVLCHRYSGIVVKRLHIRINGTIQIRGDNETTPSEEIDPRAEDTEWTIVAHVLRVEKPL